jgi:2,3-bisphosphoglycerate-independent phosphoglycerate mutase
MKFQFYPGVQYRHILRTPTDYLEADCTPPHDIIDQAIESHLPNGEAAAKIIDLMERSKEIFANHPVNQKRKQEGKPEATQIWLWGQGKSPKLVNYKERLGLTGGVISAVDLIQGIGRLSGLEVIIVEGATGLPDTNYEGKAEAALKVLEDHPFVCIHVESTDEMGHAGDEARKTEAIRDFDQRMLRIVYEGLKNLEKNLESWFYLTIQLR